MRKLNYNPEKNVVVSARQFLTPIWFARAKAVQGDTHLHHDGLDAFVKVFTQSGSALPGTFPDKSRGATSRELHTRPFGWCGDHQILYCSSYARELKNFLDGISTSKKLVPAEGQHNYNPISRITQLKVGKPKGEGMKLKQRTKPVDNPRVMLYEQTEHEEYKRYKRIKYVELAVKCFFAFVFGVLTAYILKS